MNDKTLTLAKAGEPVKKHPEFEYNVRFVSATDNMHSQLTPMGVDGWELCAIVPTGQFGSGNFELIFKRRK